MAERTAARGGDDALCRICESPTTVVGNVPGRVLRRSFALRRCAACGFAFVANPATNYAEIYTLDYYAGRGADPLVDYFDEVTNFTTTVRQYEWRGIVSALASVMPLDSTSRWLDYGCGTGGLVRYVREHVGCDVMGYEQGPITQHLARERLPLLMLTEFNSYLESFDIVTAIEVLEHIADPLGELQRIRALLKPGGAFFYTTGNAAPFRDRLISWRYVIPEIHVSFFEPQTMEVALSKARFRPEPARFRRGGTDIVRYKVLKNLGLRRQTVWEKLVPWAVVSRLVNARYGLLAHPIGRAA